MEREAPYTAEEVEEIQPNLDRAFSALFQMGQKVALSTPVGAIWGYVSAAPRGAPQGLYLWGGFGYGEPDPTPTCVIYVPPGTPYALYLPVRVEDGPHLGEDGPPEGVGGWSVG